MTNRRLEGKTVSFGDALGSPKNARQQQDFLSDGSEEIGLFYAKVHRHCYGVFRDDNITRSGIMVYLDLAFHCNVRTGALHRRDIQQVATNAGISRRRVFSALVELEEVGLVTRQQFTLGGRLPHVGLATARAALAHERDDDDARGNRNANAEYQRKARALEEAYGLDVSKMSREDIDRLINDLRLKLKQAE